jgi:hypothetical protein
VFAFASKAKGSQGPATEKGQGLILLPLLKGKKCQNGSNGFMSK